MTVFIYPNFEKEHSESCTREAVKILKSLNCDVVMRVGLGILIEGVHYLPIEECAKKCDVMISVGGDGTILKCAKLASTYSKELLGINCGRLGFMASLERSELGLLKSLISGDYKVERRMMLDAKVLFEDGSETVLTALNEAVISSGFGRSIHDFTVIADGITVSSLRADGLIFSTPTGASAYSLSAGGPLIEPTLDCIEFTQICPHSLFARTMLFSPDKNIEIRYKASENCHVLLSVDGQNPIEISERDRLAVTKSESVLKLIDIRGSSYFRAINEKLMQPAKSGRDIKEREK